LSLVTVERQAIEAALAQTGGKVAPPARILGLSSRHTLYRLMEKHGLRRAGAADGEGDE
jgi:transcriptional regulator of acetoin/glycerol metabolism